MPETLHTPRLALLPSHPRLAAWVADFYACGREAFAAVDPPRPPAFFTAAGQRRLLAGERKMMAQQPLPACWRVWLVARAEAQGAESNPPAHSAPPAARSGSGAPPPGRPSPAAGGSCSPASRPSQLPAHSAPIIGTASLGTIMGPPFLSAYVGYKLAPTHTGQGYMTEAVAALVRFAFGPLGLHRLEANIMPRNTPSLRVAKRLGFTEEGLARRYLNIGGVWEDHIHMVLLNEPGWDAALP